jgi:hypothetical protein
MPTVAGWTPGGQSNTYYEPVRWPHAPTPGWGTVWANDQRFTKSPQLAMTWMTGDQRAVKTE